MAAADDDKLSFDLDCSFTSTTSSSSFLTSTTTTSTSSSARSSLSLSLPSFSSSSLISPHPHSASSPSSLWPAVRAASSLSSDRLLHPRHLRLLRHLGSGHLARVFHCRLKGLESLDFDFALKVIDLNATTSLDHVRTEAHVLSSLDHPFLPTLYARMEASHYSCFLIDYCPGGDLHSLLARHPSHKLPVHAVRFFAAEVLLALEYLHALGFVYRDLKPENVLIRADGHVMLSDFDLCFSAADTNASTDPYLHRSRRRRRRAVRKRSNKLCYFNTELQEEEEEEEEEILQVVAEPVSAFSTACVGTHEYLAPEIVGGNGHGCGVDWWAFGVFVYELLYGRTPFKGATKDATLKNVMKKELRFPEEERGNKESAMARDLVKRLLVRDVKGRLGSQLGAAEIKSHPFFQGVRWQLMRGEKSPVVVVGPAGAVVVKGGGERRGAAGWWSRVVKRGIKLGSISSNHHHNHNHNNIVKGRRISIGINKSVVKEKRRQY